MRRLDETRNPSRVHEDRGRCEDDQRVTPKGVAVQVQWPRMDDRMSQLVQWRRMESNVAPRAVPILCESILESPIAHSGI